jgi:hypothetical protein
VDEEGASIYVLKVEGVNAELGSADRACFCGHAVPDFTDIVAGVMQMQTLRYRLAAQEPGCLLSHRKNMKLGTESFRRRMGGRAGGLA